MELEILGNRVEKTNQNLTQDFINELQKNLENDKWNKQNFINELASEFSISQGQLKDLNKKIDNFLESLYFNVGTINYISFDSKANKFYENYSTDKGMEKSEMLDEWAKSYGVGTFFIHFKNAFINDNVWYRDGNFIKKDIKNTIKEYLSEGYDIENINFSKLKEKYNNISYVKKIAK